MCLQCGLLQEHTHRYSYVFCIKQEHSRKSARKSAVSTASKQCFPGILQTCHLVSRHHMHDSRGRVWKTYLISVYTSGLHGKDLDSMWEVGLLFTSNDSANSRPSCSSQTPALPKRSIHSWVGGILLVTLLHALQCHSSARWDRPHGVRCTHQRCPG